MLKKHLTSRHSRQLGALLAADTVLFAGTEVSRVPSVVVMVGFLLLAVTMYYGIYLLLKVPAWYGLPVRGKRRLALYVTSIIAGLVALQSIGELSSRDILVLLPLAILAYSYSAYARAGRRNLSV